MLDPEAPSRERLIDPVDRICEILFGLIMAVTIVGSLSIAEAGRGEVRTVLAAALGCNLAWGLVDGVMYLLRAFVGRTRTRALAAQVVTGDAATAHRLILHAMPDDLAEITGPDELEGMRRRLAALPPAPGRVLDLRDFLAAFGVFLLVVLATFPVVVPFLLTDDASLAMRLSQGVSVGLLLLSGVALGRYAGHTRPWVTGIIMMLFGVLLVAAVKALGG
jgi:VIT1/CCC1 family predicted Fe2+/Mn2+ transporter